MSMKRLILLAFSLGVASLLIVTFSGSMNKTIQSWFSSPLHVAVAKTTLTPGMVISENDFFLEEVGKRQIPAGAFIDLGNSFVKLGGKTLTTTEVALRGKIVGEEIKKGSFILSSSLTTKEEIERKNASKTVVLLKATRDLYQGDVLNETNVSLVLHDKSQAPIGAVLYLEGKPVSPEVTKEFLDKIGRLTMNRPMLANEVVPYFSFSVSLGTEYSEQEVEPLDPKDFSPDLDPLILERRLKKTADALVLKADEMKRVDRIPGSKIDIFVSEPGDLSKERGFEKHTRLIKNVSLYYADLGANGGERFWILVPKKQKLLIDRLRLDNGVITVVSSGSQFPSLSGLSVFCKKDDCYRQLPQEEKIPSESELAQSLEKSYELLSKSGDLTKETSLCRIKGTINSTGTRIFFTPGSIGYDALIMDISRGDRWFCHEKDAIDLGWKQAV